jgi:hypothetical protein
MEIIINSEKIDVSDENEELLTELVNRIINEDVHGETGEADFDIQRLPNACIDGTLVITFELNQ